MGDSPSSISALDDQDESVRIAVKALDDMRNSTRTDSRSTPAPSTSSSPHSSTSAPKSSPQLTPMSSQNRDSVILESSPPSSPDFVSRVSNIPLVNSAIRAYEQGKASSRVVKYGVEMVESSVKTISRPVMVRLSANVNQLDEFACKQLDKLDRYRRPSTSDSLPSESRMLTSPPPTSERERGRPKLKTKTFDGTVDEEFSAQEGSSSMANRPRPRPTSRREWREQGGEKGIPSWLEANSPFMAPPPLPPPDLRSSPPTQNRDESHSERSQSKNSSENQVVQRSRWQAVLLEAGGISAALSEESMRRLKYCLEWLQYATGHIDAQILILRDFTASLQPLPSDNLSAARRPPISDEQMRKLSDVRKDLIQTVRQVVDVVSKYAGSALPEPARNRVRGFILTLPQKFSSRTGPGVDRERERESETVAAASGSGSGAMRRAGGQRRAAHRERGSGEGVLSGASSRAPSPSPALSSPRVGRATLNHNGHNSVPVSASTALQASQRILALATESLDMMRNVTGVVKDSLDRADAWVGRFRSVGIQRGSREREDNEDSEFEAPNHQSRDPWRESRHLHKHEHRRAESSQSFEDFDGASERGSGGSGMPSPFLSGSSMTWGSSTSISVSVPPTPGFYESSSTASASASSMTTYGGSSAAASTSGTGSGVNGYGGYASNAPSPGGINLSNMTLGSAAGRVVSELDLNQDPPGTPSRWDTMSGVSLAQEEEEEEDDRLVTMKEWDRDTQRMRRDWDDDGDHREREWDRERERGRNREREGEREIWMNGKLRESVGGPGEVKVVGVDRDLSLKDDEVHKMEVDD